MGALRITLLFVVVGCATRAPVAGDSTPQPPPVQLIPDEKPFDHALHDGSKPDARLTSGAPKCIACHVLTDPARGTLSRPGTADHAPCDTCHRPAFFQPPGRLCTVCHTQVDPRTPSKTVMAEWPPAGRIRQRASVFDHRLHLDNEKMERIAQHVDCKDCHKLGGETATKAAHEVCGPCHGGALVRREATEKPPFAMNECEKCHTSEQLLVPQGRRFITKDLIFSHAKHERDRKGNPIFCSNCHGAVAESRNVEHIELPAMVDCAKCHESDRVSDNKRIANCDTCHTQITAGVAPRNHLGHAIPDNHTLAFRSDHADAARSDKARCRFCHGGMSGTTRDACYECHVTMKPRDHTLRWASFDHGPEAAMRRENCATCHEADYCSRCHSMRPRSHLPFESFVGGGHGVEARLNMRTCMACHSADTCARCHQGRAF
jgi:hypothetical protein